MNQHYYSRCDKEKRKSTNLLRLRRTNLINNIAKELKNTPQLIDSP